MPDRMKPTVSKRFFVSPLKSSMKIDTKVKPMMPIGTLM
jgi:hypothetical protein